MNNSLYQQTNNDSRHPNRRRPRSPGVALRGRALGLGYWDDEVTADGGKRKARRLARARGKAAIRAAVLDATT